MDLLVLSVAEFCSTHGISRAKFYQLQDEGLAPTSFFVGRRRLITLEAAQQWRTKMEARSAACFDQAHHNDQSAGGGE